MTKVNITYTCGCGFRTTVLEEAVKHSQATNHVLTVLGDIRPSQRRLPKAQ